MDIRNFAQKLTQKLTDDGLIIESGWVGLRPIIFKPETDPEVLKLARQLFFAGAQHLFSSIMTLLEPGAEPTSSDEARLQSINKELQKFLRELMAEINQKVN